MTLPGTPNRETKVLLVGWAGADWPGVDPLLDAGEMPALHDLVNTGVRGRLAPVRPLLSPMLWTSAITGKRADKHGICSFYEPLADDTGLVPVSGLQRRCDAIWDRVTDSVVVGWPVTSPAESIRGTIVGSDAAKSTAAMATDPIVAACCNELIRASGGRRSIAPLVDQVIQTHAEACELIVNKPWRFAAVCYPVLASWQATADGVPSDPTSAAQRRRLAWRLQDALLAELRNAVGPDTDIVLVSPHAPSRSEITSSGSEEQGSQLGMFCAAGPQFHSGKVHHGATVLDVTPTVLRLLGLVEDSQTDGEPWLECMKLDGDAFSRRAHVRQQLAGTTPPAPKERPEFEVDATQVLAADRASCLQVRENQRVNLALALSDSNRVPKAIACWRALLEERPDNETYVARLIECLMRDRQHAECRRVIGKLAPEIANRTTFQFVLAEIAAAEGHHDEAAAIAVALSSADDTSQELLARAARVLSTCGDFSAAEALFFRLFACDGADVFAHAGLAGLYWEQDRLDLSLVEARKALAKAPAMTEARFTLARSLHRIGQKAEAISEFERCLNERWCLEETHSYLASLYWADDPARAAYHRERANVA